MILLALMAVALVAGMMNAVAGGGSFLTFPTLVFAGIPPVVANATNTVALFPASFASAWAYRHDFPSVDGIRPSAMLAISIAGGLLGALLLIFTPERTFVALIPWLLLAATVLFASSKRVTPWLKKRVHFGTLQLGLAQFCISVYGGYFGGAIGILMLAAYALFGLEDINAMNALKTLLAGVLNGVAVLCFALAGKVAWAPALLMMAAATAGGYIGAHVARRMNPDHVRLVIIAIGLSMSAVFFFK